MWDGKNLNLVCNVRSGIANVAVHLAHHTDMLVTVEQRVFLLALATGSIATETGLVSLKTGIRENDDQSLRIFIGRRDRNMLFGDELR